MVAVHGAHVFEVRVLILGNELLEGTFLWWVRDIDGYQLVLGRVLVRAEVEYGSVVRDAEKSVGYQIRTSK